MTKSEIVIPMFYFVDENGNKIYDEDEMRKEFEYQLEQIKKNELVAKNYN